VKIHGQYRLRRAAAGPQQLRVLTLRSRYWLAGRSKSRESTSAELTRADPLPLSVKVKYSDGSVKNGNDCIGIKCTTDVELIDSLTKPLWSYVLEDGHKFDTWIDGWGH